VTPPTALGTDFFSLTPDRVMAAVEALVGQRATLCYPLNSLENRVYEVELEDRTRRVAKFYRPGRWSDAQVAEEHTFLADLVAAEIPAVAPLPYPDGSTARRDPETGILCALFPRVGGRAPEEFTDAQLERLGALLGRIHNVGASRAAPHRVALTVDHYGRASRDTLLAAPTLPPSLATSLSAVCEALFARIEPLFDGVATHRIHGDCHPGNLLWGRDGAFFLDFDDMVTGPAVQDVWMLLPGSDDDARRQRDVLLTAYAQFRDFDRTTLRLIEPLRALRYLHYAAWITRRWGDPSFPRVFPQYGEQRYWSELVVDLSEQLARIDALDGAVARSTPTARGPAVSVAAVGWSDDAFARVWMVREEVFCDELGRSYEVEGDDDDRRAVHLVALDAEGRAVGCARLVRRGDVVELGRVAVRANRRRQGFGAALVRAAVARAEGASLAVSARPETVAFFEALGFAVVGDDTGPEGAPARRMRRSP
jgi:Ser/Thr protein kinase RdoA (MazF antagonist)/predicted GNAT family N-acyltransferase